MYTYICMYIYIASAYPATGGRRDIRGGGFVLVLECLVPK